MSNESGSAFPLDACCCAVLQKQVNSMLKHTWMSSSVGSGHRYPISITLAPPPVSRQWRTCLFHPWGNKTKLKVRHQMIWILSNIFSAFDIFKPVYPHEALLGNTKQETPLFLPVCRSLEFCGHVYVKLFSGPFSFCGLWVASVARTLLLSRNYKLMSAQ